MKWLRNWLAAGRRPARKARPPWLMLEELEVQLPPCAHTGSMLAHPDFMGPLRTGDFDRPVVIATGAMSCHPGPAGDPGPMVSHHPPVGGDLEASVTGAVLFL